MDFEEHHRLTSVIKGLHDHLRRAYSKCEGDYNCVWTQHLNEDEEMRKCYSEAMLKLATQKWPDSRIRWCVETSIDYFYNGGLQRSVLRERRCRNNSSIEIDATNIYSPSVKLKLLDVGSCYNPFSDYETFETLALDLAPANESVYQCDFLQLEVVPECELAPLIVPGQTVTVLPASSFDILVFSLVLEYLPASEQRLHMCDIAWQLLKTNGILLIITPDSKSVNHNAPMMKCWKKAIETLGFWRFRYEKQQHLHCVAFRKSSRESLSYAADAHKLMYIPQDFKVFDEDILPIDRTLDEDDDVSRNFEELPDDSIFI